MNRWTTEQHRAYRTQLQTVTGREARRTAEPWTVLDDLTLWTDPGTLTARARKLQRTYYACSARLVILRDPYSSARLRLERYAPHGRLTA
jgi:hypothetical protein